MAKVVFADAVAVGVCGAGTENANGVYLATGRTWHDAPVYENSKQCLLSREPHRNSKTGETCYGWIIGEGRKPLYAAQTDAKAPPSSGWHKFKGAAPIPTVQGPASEEDMARVAVLSWKERGNSAFTARKYEAAIALYTRALEHEKLFPMDDPDMVGLYSNRSEAALRRRRWDDALRDALEASQRRPDYVKALLRGAVAAMELARYQQAQDLLDRCLKINPHNPDAQQAAQDLARRWQTEDEEHLPARFRAANWKRTVSGGEMSVNSNEDSAGEAPPDAHRTLKVFSGYGKARERQQKQVSIAAAAVPIEALPYRNMGLPQEQVELMDDFFREMRAQRAERERNAQEEKKDYERIKREWRERAEDGVASGRLEPVAQLLPSAKALAAPAGGYPATGAASTYPARMMSDRFASDPPPSKVNPTLPQEDRDEIDALFARQPGSTGNLPAVPAQDALRGARLLRALDRAAAKDKKALAERLASEIEALSRKAGGEPTRFEQARGEVTCSWALPDGVSGRDVSVAASEGGARLKIEVRGKAIFDGALFDRIAAGDIVWTLADQELHLTLTKADRDRLWEQLGAVPEVRRDATGAVVPESVPTPLSMSERLAKFREMVQGDDGQQVGYDDLDPRAKELVDAMRRYEHARAGGDEKALALAELDLEEFGKLTV